MSLKNDKKSAQGYDIVKMYMAKDGRMYAIAKRDNKYADNKVDYIIAAGYDKKDGTWDQGYYGYETFEEAKNDIKRVARLSGREVVEDAKEDEYVFKLSKRKNDYDEYVVRAYKNGRYYEDATYYTDDWEDANDTLQSLAEQNGLEVIKNGGVFVAQKKKELTKEPTQDSKDKISFVLSRQKEEVEDDYEIKGYRNGEEDKKLTKRFATFDDALEKLYELEETYGLMVTQKGNTFVADCNGVKDSADVVFHRGYKMVRTGNGIDIYKGGSLWDVGYKSYDDAREAIDSEKEYEVIKDYESSR